MDAWHAPYPLTPVRSAASTSTSPSKASPLAATSRRASTSNNNSSSTRPRLREPLTLPPSASNQHAPVVGSPVNFRNNSHRGAGPDPVAVPVSSASVVSLERHKPRPSTALALSSSSTIHSLLAAHGGGHHQTTNSGEPRIPSLGSRAQSLTRSTSSSPSSSTTTPLRTTQRCSGCGAFAELCMACFAHFRAQDGAAYKKQVSGAAEVLFQRATHRAFTKMARVVQLWVFGVWQRETRQQAHRRRAMVTRLARARRQRVWTSWRLYVYQRRILGAMLYAEQQQALTASRAGEIATLHGDVFELQTQASVHRHVQHDAVNVLQRQLDGIHATLRAKNDELLAMRHALAEAVARTAELERHTIDPRELERLRTENADFKAVVFQLAAAMSQSMETQLEVLATSEGRQQLGNVFTKDVLQQLDKPEQVAFYNPLVDLAPVDPPASSNTGNRAVEQLVARPSYDAAVDRADRILLQWVNSVLQPAPGAPEWITPPPVTDFHTSFADGRAYVVLTKTLHAAMCRIKPRRPAGAPASKLDVTSVLRENGEELTEIAMERYVEHVAREEEPRKRLELMITTIGQALWLPTGLLTANDIIAGDAEFNFASLSYLFCTASPCLDESFHSCCNELKVQLSSLRAKWRELRERASAPTSVSASQSGPATAAGAGAVAVADTQALIGTQDPTEIENAALSKKIKIMLAQTLEFKKRLEGEDVRAREGHLLWWKSMRIVLRKCFLSYARMVRGKAGVLSKLATAVDENQAFAKMPRHKLGDLELPFEDFPWECKLLQSYLLTVHCDLARIYRGYATRREPTNTVINVGDLTELLTECRVLDSTSLPGTVLHSVLRTVDPHLTGDVSNHHAVPPIDFLEVLVRIARRKYSAETHRLTISECFCLLLDNFILPFAFRADADLFRKQLEDSKVRRLLLKNADELRELFAKYAIDDMRKRPTTPGMSAVGGTTSNGRQRARMSAFGFSQCLLDKNVLDVSLSSEKVLAVVQKVVGHTEPKGTTAIGARGAESASLLAGEDAMVFEQFEEAVIVIACYKFPDPYISLESRLDKFLTFYVRGNGITAERTSNEDGDNSTLTT